MEQIRRYPNNSILLSTSQGDWYTVLGDVKSAYLQGCVHLDPVLVVYVNNLSSKYRGRKSQCFTSGYIPSAGGTVSGTARILSDAFNIPTLQSCRRMGTLQLNFINVSDGQKISDLSAMITLMYADARVQLSAPSPDALDFRPHRILIAPRGENVSITPLKKPSLKALGISEESADVKRRRAVAVSWITEDTVLTYSPRTYAIKKYTVEEFHNAT